MIRLFIIYIIAMVFYLVTVALDISVDDGALIALRIKLKTDIGKYPFFFLGTVLFPLMIFIRIWYKRNYGLKIDNMLKYEDEFNQIVYKKKLFMWALALDCPQAIDYNKKIDICYIDDLYRLCVQFDSIKCYKYIEKRYKKHSKIFFFNKKRYDAIIDFAKDFCSYKIYNYLQHKENIRLKNEIDKAIYLNRIR